MWMAATHGRGHWGGSLEWMVARDSVNGSVRGESESEGEGEGEGEGEVGYEKKIAGIVRSRCSRGRRARDVMPDEVGKAMCSA